MKTGGGRTSLSEMSTLATSSLVVQPKKPFLPRKAQAGLWKATNSCLSSSRMTSFMEVFIFSIFAGFALQIAAKKLCYHQIRDFP